MQSCCCCFTIVPLKPSPSLSHHLVARVYESKAEFRSALQHEKEGYTIYKNQVRSLPCLLGPLPSLPEASARPWSCSKQPPENVLSRAREQLLPWAVPDLPSATSTSVASCKFVLLCPLCWRAASAGGTAPRSVRPLRRAAVFFALFARPRLVWS